MNFTAEDLDKIMQQRAAGTQMPSASYGRRRVLRPFFRYTKGNLTVCAFGGLFLLGVLIGTLLVSRSSPETRAALQTVLGGYLERRRLQAFSTIAFSGFLSLCTSLVILFFCGFCSIAQPIILGVPLFKGLGYGFSVGMLYAEFGTAAVPSVAVLMLPPMLCGALLLVAACRTSLRLSVTLFRSTMVEPEQADRFRVKRYLIKYGVFAGFCLLIALLDALLFTRFGGLFVLGA